MKIALVGGYDSNLMLRMLREENPDIVGVHYNILKQSESEIESLPNNCLVYDYPLNKDNGGIPDLNGRDLLLCTDVCIKHNVTDIYIGHLPEEIAKCPDGALEYPPMISKMLTFTFQRNITVHHPLVEREIFKPDLEKYAVSKGIDTSNLVSCFQVPACGSCPKCLARNFDE